MTAIQAALQSQPGKARLVELQLEGHIGTRAGKARVLEIAVVEAREIIAEGDIRIGHRRESQRRAGGPGDGIAAGADADAARGADVDMLTQIEAEVGAEPVRPAFDVIGAETVEIIARAPEETEFAAFIP